MSGRLSVDADFLCRDCGDPIEWVDGVGWCCAVKGGGYDWCDMRVTVDDTNPGHRRGRQVCDLDDSEIAAVEKEIEFIRRVRGGV